MATLKTSPKWYDRKPGYVTAERRAMFAKVGDWVFMSAHCKHKRRHTKACLGVGYHAWARPLCAK